MHKPNLFISKRQLFQMLSGTHMLALLPALCLAAYWGGGEVLFVSFALFTPLLYAMFGGFSANLSPPPTTAAPSDTPQDVAKDFLETARHHGQSTACFQIEVTGLAAIARIAGDSAAKTARDLVGQRLQSVLRGGDHVFKTGDARYVVLIEPGFRLNLDTALDLAKRMHAAVSEPLAISGTTQYLSAAIGLATSLNTSRNTTSETWLAAATQALGEAIAHAPASTRVWSEKLSQSCKSRTALREDLSHALPKGEIQAHFQPQFNLATGDVVGLEALARWDHPTRGWVGPSEFLRALEDSGEMEALGKTMLSQALAALAQFDRCGVTIPSVSVNFSETELRNPNLPDSIIRSLDGMGLTASRLRIEVMETVIAMPDDIVQKNLQRLSKEGCAIDLDDFGTGNASIATLQVLPITRLKIDQSYVRGIEARDDAQRMMSAILAMSERLKLDTLAEGVETIEEHAALLKLGCHAAQGFLLAKPMALGDCQSWLTAHAQHKSLHNNAPTTRMI